MNRYRFLEEALLEYEEAAEYYESAQAGLGASFVEAVEEVLQPFISVRRSSSIVARM